MPTRNCMHVFVTSDVIRASLIDGGDTMALRLRVANGDEIAILAPLDTADRMIRSVDEVLKNAVPWQPRRRVSMDAIAPDGTTFPVPGIAPRGADRNA